MNVINIFQKNLMLKILKFQYAFDVMLHLSPLLLKKLKIIKKEYVKSTEEKKKVRENKISIFKKLVDGNLQKEHEFGPSPEVTNEDARYFFSILLQPFVWKFPCTVIHLTRSIDGHFSQKEAEDIFNLMKLINEHKHFIARYFAADGEKSLDQYHELAFKSTKSISKSFLMVKLHLTNFLNM